MKLDNEKFEKSFSVWSITQLRIRGVKRKSNCCLFDDSVSAREAFDSIVAQYKEEHPKHQVLVFDEKKNWYDEVYRIKINFQNEYKDGQYENVIFSFGRQKVYERKLAS